MRYKCYLRTRVVDCGWSGRELSVDVIVKEDKLFGKKKIFENAKVFDYKNYQVDESLINFSNMGDEEMTEFFLRYIKILNKKDIEQEAIAKLKGRKMIIEYKGER